MWDIELAMDRIYEPIVYKNLRLRRAPLEILIKGELKMEALMNEINMLKEE